MAEEKASDGDGGGKCRGLKKTKRGSRWWMVRVVGGNKKKHSRTANVTGEAGRRKNLQTKEKHTHSARAIPALPRWLPPEAGPTGRPAALFAAVAWRRAATLSPTPELVLLFRARRQLMNFSNGINVCRLNMNELKGEPDREGLWLVRRY